MKLLSVVLSALFLLIVTAFVFLAYQSKTVPKLGLLEGRLAPCTSAQNCVNSMMADSRSVEPIRFKGEDDNAWMKMKETIQILGGNIEQEKDNYLWATFRSSLFSFIDDVEIVMDKESKLFNIRSASRVGRSDFSVNRKRVEALQKAFIE